MEKTDYLDRLLAKYAGTFDIYTSYSINNKKYPAYGYFFSCNEKYVLTRKANLWTAKVYEHIIFMDVENCTEETLKEAYDIISGYLEPECVRKNEKYPEKDHMYSYLTVAIISEHEPDTGVKKLIRKFRFDKGYMFNMRGHSEGHLVVSVMDTGNVYTNAGGRPMKAVYKKTFDEVRKGAIGYSEAFGQSEKAL